MPPFERSLSVGHWRDTVLVIEDDHPTRTLIMRTLAKSHFLALGAGTGEDGLEQLETREIQLILLDILLPGMDGFEVCRRVRASGRATPIIFLSILGDTKHLVHGLTLGADDFVTKPFVAEELVARVKAVLRRERQIARNASQVRFRNLKIDYPSQKCFKNGQALDLTPTEFHLLAELFTNQGNAVSRSTLSSHVWGPHHHGSEKSLDVYIARLRHKVEDDPAEPSLIRTVRGYGYVCQ